MNGIISVSVVLLCVWCSLDADRLLMVVTAQPTVSVMIVTPEADRKEGGQVEMRCVATNLESDHIVAWRTEDPVWVLRWGVSTITAETRFVFNTMTDITNGVTVQDFTITNVQRADAEEYVCIINEPISTGGSEIVARANVTLSVYYFPSESFPVCSPTGPITVDTGTQLHMRCTSEVGNPIVTMAVSQVSMMSNSYTWISSSIGTDTVLRTLDLTVDVTDDDVTFKCVISSLYYFPDMMRSCTIGPIKLSNITEPTPTITTSASNTLTTNISYDTSAPNTAVIAGAVTGAIVALLIILILIIIFLRRQLCNFEWFFKNSKANTNPTNVEFTPDQTEPSQSNFNEYAGLDTIQEKFPNNQNTVYQTPVATVTGPVPEPGVSYSGRTSGTRNVEDTSLLYAKPHKVKHTMDNAHDARKQHSDSTTEQSYDNPMFDSKDSCSTLWPSEGRSSTTLKPTAMVEPISIAPRKPKPYKPKTAEGTSNVIDKSLNKHDYKMPPPSQAPPQPPPMHSYAGTPSQKYPSASHEGTYVEVSVPQRQIDNDEHTTSDYTVYADLDLQQVNFEYTSQPLSASEPVVYATVMKTKKH